MVLIGSCIEMGLKAAAMEGVKVSFLDFEPLL